MKPLPLPPRSDGYHRLPDEVSELVTLRKLIVLGNVLDELPHGITALTQLTLLVLDSTYAQVRVPLCVTFSGWAGALQRKE